MSALLIVLLLSGEHFAIPMKGLEACRRAEAELMQAQIKWSACVLDKEF